jgi:hypothetical protein
MKKRRQERKLKRIEIMPTPACLDAAIAADHQWFKDNPGQHTRFRDMTDAEAVFTGYRPYVTVEVSLLSDGVLMRKFVRPDWSNN